MAAAVLGLGVTAYHLYRNKINVTAIANVELLTHSPVSTNQLQPLSKLAELTKTTDENRSGNENKEVVSGYLANLDDVCRTINGLDDKELAALPSNPLVIVKTNAGATAGTIKVDKKTCDLVMKLKGDERIYATSDKPFVHVDSKKAYLAVAQ